MYERLDQASQFVFDQPLAKSGEIAILYFILNGSMFAFSGAFFYLLYKTIRILYA